MINDLVLKHAEARNEFDVDFAMENAGVGAMKDEYAPSLKQIFQFYAGVCQTSGSVARSKGKDVNAMMSAMQFEPFLQFAADFNLTASVLLTTTQIADIFLSSLKVAPGDVERGGLNFDHFWESLVRCAMVAYKDRKHVDPTNKLRALFLYMSVRIEESVPRAINASGRASSSTNSQHLLAGSKRFQFLVTEQWNKDDRKNYLEPKAKQQASAMNMLMNMDLGGKKGSRSPKKRMSPQKGKKGRWKTATDKKTGKTYYYTAARRRYRGRSRKTFKKYK